VDGIDVFRIFVGQRSVFKSFSTVPDFISFFLSNRNEFQIVHLHGFTKKSMLLVLLAKVFRKKVIILLTSVGHDDHQSMKGRGFLINWFFSRADLYVGLSPRFYSIYESMGSKEEHFRLIPNGVDSSRFCPVTNEEKAILRYHLRLPGKMKLIVFVGHFSREKCPDILFEAWKCFLLDKFPDTGIVFVGSTNPDHYEVDTYVVKKVKRLARTYQGKRIFFVERTHETEKYYQAADIFVMPSLREGLPNAMLEAMSCELPVVVSRLEGVTDWVVENGVNGLLISPGNGGELSEALIRLLGDAELSNALGKKARKTIKKRFRIEKMAGKYEKLYKNPSIN
jgi:glycosyltransferase involved in cell wall biosynthesis